MLTGITLNYLHNLLNYVAIKLLSVSAGCFKMGGVCHLIFSS